ncbi:MAG: chemotaxis response regulator protein-glutamate methylesterase [Candidatus Riflebacteria bacterium]|nr:chemotaxis response regulator protein-glutamate methylesterase [Candidatus Riflebacteria bacterium]
MPLKTLVVDDTILFRKILVDVLARIPEVLVVGTALNGRMALEKARELSPDLITLDLEMPDMDGLQVLRTLRSSGNECGVIIASAYSIKGGESTIQALEMGAFDFIAKPLGSTIEESRNIIFESLQPKIKAFQKSKEVRAIFKGTFDKPKITERFDYSQPSSNLCNFQENQRRLKNFEKPEMILIGVSTGGPSALSLLLPSIPQNFEVPIIIVQHMPPIFTQSLAESLSAKCKIKVKEVTNGETINPGTAYIAPGGKQMQLCKRDKDIKFLKLTDDPPENNCKPSVDYFFRSVATAFPGKAAAIILTGMGIDGTLGIKLLKRYGCYCIAQSQESCVIFGMPRSVIEAGLADSTLRLDMIPQKMVELSKGRF